MENQEIIRQFRAMEKSNKIVVVLEKWLKKYKVKANQYDRIIYKQIAWEILEALNK